jgi:adenylate cyclase
MSSTLRRFLREHGASDAEIARAQTDGWLPLLVVDRLLMPGEGRYDVDEVAERGQVDTETARRLWRAMGFPDVAPGVRAFTDRDLEMLRVAVGGVAPAGEGNLLRSTRVLSSSLARVAEVEAELIAEEMQGLRQAGLTEDQVGEQLLTELDWGTISELVDYVHRSQLRAALWRRLARGDDDTMVDLAIGFADLSGFTAISQELEPNRLGQLVTRWETLAFDTAAEHNARVVKTIGDEVMLAGLPPAVMHATLALVRRSSGYPELPPVRAGVAHGPLLARDGDYYGPVVNLASRLTDIARPGTVLASEPMHRALENDRGLDWDPVGTRHVRGVGDVMVYAVEESGN